MDLQSKKRLEFLAKHGTNEDRKLVAKILNDPYYWFQPRPDNPAAFDEQTSFVESDWPGLQAVIAGTGSGKSLSAAYKSCRFIRENDPEHDLTKFFVVSQNTNMAGGLWIEKFSQFIPSEMIEDISWYSLVDNCPKNVILKPSKNGNRWMISFRSYEMGRKALQSTDHCQGFLCDEQCPGQIIDELYSRLRSTANSLKMYVCTPLVPDPFLEERYNNPENYPLWKFFRMNAEENFYLKDMSWLENTLPDLYETRRIGAFIGFDGLVFKNFDPAKHCQKPPDKFHPGATTIRSIDPGWSHQTGVLLVTYFEGKMWVRKEWRDNKTLIEDKVKSIKELMPGDYINLIDSAAAQERAEFAKLGLSCTTVAKDTMLSIELVGTALSAGNLIISPECKKLISELKNYQWMTDNGKGDAKRDRPRKRDDDLVDALRMASLYFNRNRQLKVWQNMAKPRIGTI